MNKWLFHQNILIPLKPINALNGDPTILKIKSIYSPNFPTLVSLNNLNSFFILY